VGLTGDRNLSAPTEDQHATIVEVVFVIPPGHDAWTVGNETIILLDLRGSPETLPY
jgi:hypothetical protein